MARRQEETQAKSSRPQGMPKKGGERKSREDIPVQRPILPSFCLLFCTFFPPLALPRVLCYLRFILSGEESPTSFYPANLRVTTKVARLRFPCGRRSENSCDFSNGMVASPLAAHPGSRPPWSLGFGDASFVPLRRPLRCARRDPQEGRPRPPLPRPL